jgi:ribosomal protein S18 acetylase RimI-like enzyme
MLQSIPIMADVPPTPLPPVPFSVRPFCGDDAAACKALYVEGLIAPKLADNDTGLDIEDIRAAYVPDDGGQFFVAVNAAGEVVGMIGVQPAEPGVGEIRRLRVRPDHRRRGIGHKLVETAVGYCRDRGYVKVMFDTYLDREPALNLFNKFHFHHTRTRKVGEKELLIFYLDLYQRDGVEQQ